MDNGASSYHRFLDGDDYGMEELIRDYKDGLVLYLNSYLNDFSVADWYARGIIPRITKMPFVGAGVLDVPRALNEHHYSVNLLNLTKISA